MEGQYFSRGYLRLPKDPELLKIWELAKYALAKHNALIVCDEMLPQKWDTF